MSGRCWIGDGAVLLLLSVTGAATVGDCICGDDDGTAASVVVGPTGTTGINVGVVISSSVIAVGVGAAVTSPAV